jgi:hypothetical protein
MSATLTFAESPSSSLLLVLCHPCLPLLHTCESSVLELFVRSLFVVVVCVVGVSELGRVELTNIHSLPPPSVSRTRCTLPSLPTTTAKRS